MSSIDPAIEPDPAAGRASSASADHDTPAEPSTPTPETNERRTPAWRLLTPAVQRVVEWHRQRAQSRTQDS